MLTDSASVHTVSARPAMRDKLGICQWFHFEDYESVQTAVELLKELNVRHLRTGISWADLLRPGGKAWYDWQMEQLADLKSCSRSGTRPLRFPKAIRVTVRPSACAIMPTSLT